MGRPKRREQFESSEVCIVHTIQRCVRRAFLAGMDQQTGRDYSYRREWIRRRLESLASVFGIDVLTYAVMSNHLHTIVRNRPDVVAQWSDEQVAVRWLSVFPGQRLEELHLSQPTEAQVQMLVSSPEQLAVIRQRLSDISWFMRALAEPIARLANREDECTGRFWEGRFKAQRITDEAGLLACAMYVDLNPIRAAMAETPEQAVHTSAYDRLQAELGMQIDSAAFVLQAIATEEVGKQRKERTVEELRDQRRAQRRNPTGRKVLRDGWLAPLSMDARELAQDAQPSGSGLRASDKGYLNISWREYIELLRWTGRQRVSELVEKVPERLGGLLSRLGIDATMWRDLVWNYKRYFGKSSCAGSPGSMSADAQRQGKRWHRGQARVRQCFV
jgi:REP element-mobilizing transposase RayT